jgi:hypothetical protein
MYPRCCRTVAALGAATVALAASSVAAAVELPSGRAYEMVSPPQKFYGVGSADTFNGYAMADGSAFFFGSLMALPGSPDGEGNEDYRSSRGPSSWQTTPLVPATELDSTNALKDGFGDRLGVSADGQTVLYSTYRAFDPADQDYDPGALNTASDLYVRKPDGSFAWATPGPVNANPFSVNNIDWGVMSRDGAHVVFASRPALLPEDAGRTGASGLYDWHDGVLKLVGVDDSGTPLSSSEVTLGRGSNGPFGVSPNALSEDGRRIFFTVDNHVYVRVDGQTTLPLAPGSDPAAHQTFAAATPDGAKAYFQTDESLTADDADNAQDIYEFDVDKKELRLVSVGGEESTSIVRTSSDGSRVYFTANGGPGDPSGLGLYVEKAGGVDYVAPVDGMLGPGPGCNVGADSNLRVAPDGRHLVFVTTAAATADDQDASADVFEWSEDSGKVVRVSGDGDRGNDPVDAALSTAATCSPLSGRYDPPRGMSDDGRFVFFQTDEALVPQDSNGKTDVYQHDLTTGKTSLLSAGTGERESRYLDSSTSGHDVFIGTYDRLTPEDGDDRLDVYDARVGGGFPVESPARPCHEDDCQGPAGNGAPGAVTPGSSTIVAPRLIPPPPTTAKKPTLNLVRPSSGSLRTAARTGRLKLAVRASTNGKVALRVRAVAKARLVMVGSKTVTVRAAKSVGVTVRLSKRARSELRRHGRLSLTIGATLTPGGVSKSARVRLTLRRSVVRASVRPALNR